MPSDVWWLVKQCDSGLFAWYIIADSDRIALSAKVRENTVHAQHPASSELSLSLVLYISFLSNWWTKSYQAMLPIAPLQSLSSMLGTAHSRTISYDAICTYRDSRGIFRQPWDFADPVAFVQDGYRTIPILAQMALPCWATWHSEQKRSKSDGKMVMK